MISINKHYARPKIKATEEISSIWDINTKQKCRPTISNTLSYDGKHRPSIITAKRLLKNTHELQHKCFPMKSAKFLRTAILNIICEPLFLNTII